MNNNQITKIALEHYKQSLGEKKNIVNEIKRQKKEVNNNFEADLCQKIDEITEKAEDNFAIEVKIIDEFDKNLGPDETFSSCIKYFNHPNHNQAIDLLNTILYGEITNPTSENDKRQPKDMVISIKDIKKLSEKFHLLKNKIMDSTSLYDVRKYFCKIYDLLINTNLTGYDLDKINPLFIPSDISYFEEKVVVSDRENEYFTDIIRDISEECMQESKYICFDSSYDEKKDFSRTNHYIKPNFDVMDKLSTFMNEIEL